MDKVQRFIEENQHQLGYIMGEASRKWIQNDPVGAFTVGECNVFIQRYGKYHEVVEKMESFEKELKRLKLLDNMNFSVARGIVRLEDLEPGSLFIFNKTIAVKSDYRGADGACKCFIVGTGEYFWGGTSEATDLNNLMVQRAFLSPIK